MHVLRPGRTVVGRSDACDLALPSDSVSRVHCVIEERNTGWQVTDRSRHGTLVNGARVESGALSDGDEIGIGTYRARFVAATDPELRSPTSTVPMPAALHEELVEGNEARFAANRAEVTFVRGPLQGTRVPIGQARISVGGGGANVELDDKLPRGALFLRVVRGRPMVEPGAVPAFLAGMRVRDVTPVQAGEEVRIGEHGFVVDAATVEEAARELDSFGEMVGGSVVMRRLFGTLQRMAAHDAPVLLTGESGTGKELAARGLHACGPRYEGPFVAVNCAAIAETLFESELFGHEKGAFTGAVGRSDGAFHRADGGTLFLDEIGEMHLDLQAKLLRALESGEVRRVGGNAPEFPDVRVVSATNRNLVEEVRAGRFRQDLYFRLAVLTARLPALRERTEDIPGIALELMRRHHPGHRLGPDALSALQRYEWPGNVRELRNVLTRAVVMSGKGNVLGVSALEFNPWSFEGEPTPAPVPAPVSSPQAATWIGARPTAVRVDEEPERAQLVAALEQAGGNRTQAARLLGIPRSSLLVQAQQARVDEKVTLLRRSSGVCPARDRLCPRMLGQCAPDVV
ncbi:MAG: sigma 54-interacting transcriptional regulator [Myxococcota bacterium]